MDALIGWTTKDVAVQKMWDHEGKIKVWHSWFLFWFVVLTCALCFFIYWAWRDLESRMSNNFFYSFVWTLYGYWFFTRVLFLFFDYCGVEIGCKAQSSIAFSALLWWSCQLPSAYYEGSDLALQWLKSWLQFVSFYFFYLSEAPCLLSLGGFEFSHLGVQGGIGTTYMSWSFRTSVFYWFSSFHTEGYNS